MVPVDPQEVRTSVTGLTPAAAQQMLAERWRLRETPDIYQDPAWVGTLPRFPSRIQVRLEYCRCRRQPVSGASYWRWTWAWPALASPSAIRSV